MTTTNTAIVAVRAAAARNSSTRHQEACQPRPGDLAALRASLLADETATLAILVTALRRLRPELARCAAIDALGTPESYRLAQEAIDALTDDLAGMLDTREWADIDRREAA